MRLLTCATMLPFLLALSACDEMSEDYYDHNPPPVAHPYRAPQTTTTITTTTTTAMNNVAPPALPNMPPPPVSAMVPPPLPPAEDPDAVSYSFSRAGFYDPHGQYAGDNGYFGVVTTFLPPSGQCRIWSPDRPASTQAPAVPCQPKYHLRPNQYVIFGG